MFKKLNTQSPTQIISFLGDRKKQLAEISHDLCGVVCEICPLRPWKSESQVDFHCQSVLAHLLLQKKLLNDFES